jgi:ATP-binding cassette subfamily B protein
MHDGGWWTFIRYDEKTDRPAISRPLLRRALRYARPYAGQIAVMLALILVITGLNLIPPLLTRDLIDRALPGGFEAVDDFGPGHTRGAAGDRLLGVARRYLAHRFVGSSAICCAIQTSSMSLRFFTNTKTGELMAAEQRRYRRSGIRCSSTCSQCHYPS